MRKKHSKRLIHILYDNPYSNGFVLHDRFLTVFKSFIIVGVAAQMPHFCDEDSAITLNNFPSITVM